MKTSSTRTAGRSPVRIAVTTLDESAPGFFLRMATALLLLLICISTAAAQSATARSEPPTVVASISILADFVRAVAGERVQVISIVPVGGDPHTYEPVPSDARKLARAQIVFRNGLGLERWLDRLIGADQSARPVVSLTDGLRPIVEASGTYKGQPDPHLWMDPTYAIHYVRRAERALSQRFPQHAAEFARNAQGYVEQLTQLDQEFKQQLATVPPMRRRLVTTHDAYRYFCTRYGFELVASIWGISTETEPSAAEVGAIVNAVRASGVPTVFVETTINPKLMQRIAVDAKVRVGRPLYGDSVGASGSGADTYIGMMRSNLRSIVDGLTGSSE